MKGTGLVSELETVRHETREEGGIRAEYRLVKRDGGYAILAETARLCEEIDCFPGGLGEAERFFELVVREFVLPGTVGDVWRDLHVGGTVRSKPPRR